MSLHGYAGSCIPWSTSGCDSPCGRLVAETLIRGHLAAARPTLLPRHYDSIHSFMPHTDTVSRRPAISIVLPTDILATIEPVLEALRHQTIASRLEVILLSPSGDLLGSASDCQQPFASLVELAAPALTPLSIPRAIGIRAASADHVFVSETHAYLEPDALELLLERANEGAWAVVVPGFENANPHGVCSWGSFLASYGRWASTMPPGEIPEAPLYDCLYRRDVLMAMDDHLEDQLSHGDQLRRAMQARGDHIWFEPAARIRHLNIRESGPWIHEHFLIGRAIGARRARLWSRWRLFTYQAASCLIPFLLLRRDWSSVRRVAKAHCLPPRVHAGVVGVYCLKAAGELVGSLLGVSAKHEGAMTHYEVRRVDFAR